MKPCDVEISAERLHQLAALEEYFADFGIHHEIDITLAVAQLDVGQAMPFFGEGKQVLRQERDFFDVHGEFAGAGAEEISADADVVAEVEQLVEFESLFADRVFLHVNLEACPSLLQVGESGLAHQANGHDAPGHAHIDARILQLLGGVLL